MTYATLVQCLQRKYIIKNSDVDNERMWRYRLPDYEQRLLGELQKQQHRGLFCDTMLQTDGVTVPAHGCILEALRPCLSQTLPASPTPHFVHVPTVKPQALLKLVSLLYSGHLEVEGERELDEVMAAACHLGLGHLVEGWKERGTKGEEGQRQFAEAAMQTEVGEREVREVEVQTMESATDGNTPVEERSCVDSETQTVNSDTLASLPIPSHKTPCSDSFCDNGPPVLSLQNISLPQHLVHSPSIPADQSIVGFGSPMPSRNPGLDFEAGAYSTFNVTKPSSPCKCPVTPNDDSAPPAAREAGAYPEYLAAREHITKELYPKRQMENKAGAETLDPNLPTTGGVEDNKMRESEREGVACDSEVGEEKMRKSRKGRKSLSRVRQLEATETSISIKVKLRRKTRGQVWQVVSLQETTRSPQIQHPAHVPTPAPPYQPHDPQLNVDPVEESDEQIEKLLEDIMMGLNILPPTVTERDYERQSPHQDRELACEHPNNNTGSHRTQGSVGATPRVRSHGNGTGGDETSTEMAFHSVPSSSSLVPTSTYTAPPDSHPHVQPQPLTAFCHCSHHPSTPHQHPNTNAHQPHCCHSNRTEHDQVSCYAGIQGSSVHCNQNQATCRNMPVQPAPTRPAYHQCPTSQGHASWRDTGEGDPGHLQDGPLQNVLSQSAREQVFSLSMECPSANVEETTPRQTSTSQDWAQDNPTRAGLPPFIAVHSETACGHEHHHLACQGATPRKELHFPEFILPMSQGSENHSCQTISMSTWEDLRLPRCVSPINSEPPFSPVINHQSPCHHPTPPPRVHRGPQPSLRWPPWLSHFGRELQYPLVCMVHPSEICPTTLQDPNYPCRSKQCLSRLSRSSISNHNSTGDGFSSTTPDSKREERNARKKKIKNAKMSKGVQMKPKKLKDETGKRERNDVLDGPKPKWEAQELTEPRFKRRRLEESVVTFLSGDRGKNLNETQSHVNMSACSIRLSSNNKLVKGNHMDTRPSKTCPGYASETVMNCRSSERLRTVLRAPAVAPQTMKLDASGTSLSRRRTRSSDVEHGQDSLEEYKMKDVSDPESKAPIVQHVMVSKRKRGRPRKTRHGDQEVPQPACSGPIISGHKQEDVEHRGTRDKSAKRQVKPNRKYWIGERNVEVEEDRMSSAGDRTEETLSSPACFAQMTNLLKPATEVAELDHFKTELSSESQSCMGHLQTFKPGFSRPQIERKTQRSLVEVGVTALDKTTTIRRPPSVNLRKFQELLKHQHPKTRKTYEEKKKQARESVRDVGTIEEVVKLSEKCNGEESTERIFQSLGSSKTSNIHPTDENRNEIVRPAKSSKQSEDKASATSETEKTLREERETVTGVLENLEGILELPLDMNAATVERTITEDAKLVQKKHNEEYGENSNSKSKARQFPTLSEITDMTKIAEPEMGFRGRTEKNSKEKSRLFEKDRCLTEKEKKGSVEVDISSEELDAVGGIQRMHICTSIKEVSGEEEEIDVGVDEVSLEKEHPSAQPKAACTASAPTRQEDTESVTASIGCLTPDHICLSQNNKMTQSKENTSSNYLCRVTPGSTGSSDQEEVEVDILVCSPCSQPIVWEEGLAVPEFTSEEEMEEEENEIDVIGYQTD